jgi:hypothetical protein
MSDLLCGEWNGETRLFLQCSAAVLEGAKRRSQIEARSLDERWCTNSVCSSFASFLL